MNIKIISIAIQGFMSFGDCQRLELVDGNTSIIGINKTDNYSESNGSGKSALLESLVWCLTGATTRGISADKVINESYRDIGCFVEVGLYIGDEFYEVRRYRGHHQFGNQVVILHQGNDISGNTATKSNQILSELIPVSYEDLTTMVVISQSLPGKFSNLSPSGRKTALENLGNYADQVESAKSQFNDRKKASDQEIEVVRSIIQESNNSIKVSESSIANLNSDLVKETNLLADQEIRKAQHREEVAAIDAKILEAKKGLESIQTEWDDLTREKSEINSRLDYERSRVSNLRDKYASLDSDIIKSRREIETCMHKITKYDEPSPICPTCDQEIKDVNKIESMKLELRNLIALKEESIVQLEIDKNESHRSIPDIESLVVGLEESRKNIENGMDSLSPRRSQYLRALNTLYPWFTEISDRTDTIRERIELESDNIKKCRSAIEIEEKKLPALEERARLLSDIVKDISRGEFRNFLLDRTMKSFNEILRVISLPIMKDGIVQLLLSEGSKVEITYKDRIYEQMSSGERRRLDIAVELTKRKYKSLVTGITFNLLVLDEILDTLDATGISSIFDAVEVSGACEVFMIISHRSDISMDYSQRVRVIKEDGSSRLEVE